MSIRKYLLMALACAALSSFPARAVDYASVRFHNEASDTLRLNELLTKLQKLGLRHSGDVVAAAGQEFLGTPYVAHTLEGEPECLTVNLDELDCTTFVENALALAMTVGENRTSWRDFLYNLERERYRNGTLHGYSSRLHYVSDWAVDNMHRGNIQDATPTFSNYSYAIKSLDFMTTHADKYAALADSANLAAMKSVEMGYRSHRFPYIKTMDTGNKNVVADFRNGDVVAFVLKDKSLDVGHLGLLVIKDGKPYVMHASQTLGKVAVTDVPLQDFLKKNRQFVGVRIFRLAY